MATFVGRDGELNAIVELAATHVGGPAVALVTGDAGSGKSRLLAEATARIPWRRFDVIGYETERLVPLAAASEVLRDIAQVPGGGSQLASLLFETSGAMPAGLAPLRVFEAAHRALQDHESALLLLDDLQWVDDLSAALCHYLLRASRLSGRSLMLLAASRPSASASAFESSVTQAVGAGRLTAIELGPLSRDEGVELVVAVSPGLDRAAAVRLWERAAGSPFWLEALASSSLDADVGQLVTRRLRGAGADASNLLALLAVAGRPMSVAETASLQEWPAERAQSAASELANRGVVVEAGAALRLTHDLIREAAERELPGSVRRAFHRRLAEYLEEEAGDDLQLLRQALEHHRAGGLAPLEVATRLARSPRRQLLGREGLAQLAAVVDESDAADPAVLVLEAAIARLAVELGDYSVAVERWALVGERRSDPDSRAAAFVEASRAACMVEREADARAYLGRANELAEDDPVLSLELSTAEVFIGTYFGPITAELLDRSRDATQAARALVAGAGGVGGVEPRARRAFLAALRLEVLTAMMRDDLATLLGVCDEAAAVARGFDDEAALEIDARTAYGLTGLGRLADAESRYRRVWLESRRRVLPTVSVDTGYWLVRVLEIRGDVRKAEVIAADVSKLAARINDATEIRRVHRQRQRLALLSSDWREAFRRLEAAASSEPYDHDRVQYHATLALWAARVDGRGLAKEALAYHARARADAAAAGCPRCAIEIDLEGGEIFARVGREEEARAALARWDAAIPKPFPLDLLLRRRADALLAVLNGDTARAVAGLTAVHDEAERLGAVLLALWTRLDLGKALVPADRHRAAQTLRSASELAFSIGALTVHELAEQVLRSLGVRTWKRGPSAAAPGGIDALSEREREIAELAGSGASNPEIAQVLFLSRKTVERHLTNVYAKVGARNRTELASLLRTPPSD